MNIHCSKFNVGEMVKVSFDDFDGHREWYAVIKDVAFNESGFTYSIEYGTKGWGYWCAWIPEHNIEFVDDRRKKFWDRYGDIIGKCHSEMIDAYRKFSLHIKEK